MTVKRAKLTARRFVIEVEGQEHLVPKGCDVVKGEQLANLHGKDVEVLMSKDTIVAVRALDPEKLKHIIITCYLVPPEISLGRDVMAKMEPHITKALVESGHLDPSVASKLEEFSQIY